MSRYAQGWGFVTQECPTAIVSRAIGQHGSSAFGSGVAIQLCRRELGKEASLCYFRRTENSSDATEHNLSIRSGARSFEVAGWCCRAYFPRNRNVSPAVAVSGYPGVA